MTREEFVSIPLIETRIRILEQNIKALRSLATSLSAPLGGDRVQSSGTADRVGKMVADIADAEMEMDEQIQKLTALKLEALEMINRLPEPEQGVVRLRYVSGLTWERVADEAGYSIQNCYLLRRKAITRLFGD